MQAIPLTCPNCGAGLGALEGGQYRCAYCGHRSLPPKPALDASRQQELLAQVLARFDSEREANRARARTAREAVAERARQASQRARIVNGWVLVGVGLLFFAFAAVCFAGGAVSDEPGAVLAFGLFWAAFGGAMFWGGRRYGRAARRERRLLATGLRGRAVVLSYREGNLKLDGNSGFDLVLRVELPGREPYVVKQHDWVPRPWAVTDGADLPVLVDGARATDVMVDWYVVR